MDKLKLLIIDDEKDALEAMRMGLETDKSYEIVTSFSRNDAINIIKSKPIDIVITDLKLKDGTGLDIVKYIPWISRFELAILLGLQVSTPVKVLTNYIQWINQFELVILLNLHIYELIL